MNRVPAIFHNGKVLAYALSNKEPVLDMVVIIPEGNIYIDPDLVTICLTYTESPERLSIKYSANETGESINLSLSKTDALELFFKCSERQIELREKRAGIN